MTFILLTGSIMAISIFLIYRLCRLAGIEMKWISLVLCAVLAFIVNALAISMSAFLDRTHYFRLGVLVVLAAALVTLVNEHLLRREERKKEQESPIPAETDAAALPPDQAAQPEPAAALPAAEKAMPDRAEAGAAVREQKPSAEEERRAEEAARAKADAVHRAKALRDAREKARQQAAETLQRRQEEEARQKAEAAKQRREAEQRQREAEAQRQRKKQQEAEAQRQRKKQQEAAVAAFRPQVESLDTLDALLDFAYEQAAHEPAAAICAYQQAIARFPEDSYTPFLIIELGNIYKEQAAYQDAIDAYQHALSLPIIAANDAIRQEFAKNIRYLGIVQNILSKHHALQTPFRDIPGAIMQEIETEFLHSGSQSK
ncbi:hypothetical protein FYJ78_06005 [Selenomonas sp. WCA-380-WT-3B 3/]|uniref:Tetratricopeptide repeat protein n=1 Tax=Selenomonas montiformis TaxID=2652285 RepID=A0A6I2UXE5_9FIRM|nr:hypothetical protein [Selenomonas montiformis]MSV24744.1 hypothetical protein [Selenomonas montiformis]